MPTWTRHTANKGGHRLFTASDRPGVFIADESGATPDTCDDGPVRVVDTFPYGAVRHGVCQDGPWTIPVIDGVGSRGRVRIADELVSHLKRLLPSLDWVE